jgi:hypothetical protein
LTRLHLWDDGHDGRERGTHTSAAGVTMSKRARKRRDRKKKGANHGKRPTC